MFKYFINIFILNTIFTTSVSCVKLPKEFEKCPLPLPELDGKENECLKNGIQKGIQFLSKKGSKDIGAIDADPLTISQVVIERGENSPVSIKISFLNNAMFGSSNLVINRVWGTVSSPKNFKLYAEAFGKEYTMVGPYNIDGKVLLVPIRGEGYSNLAMENVRINITVFGSPMIKNGEEYLRIDYCHLDLDPARLRISLDNLFGGNRVLGDNMNKFLNNNWEPIYRELRPVVEDAFSTVYKSYMKRIFDNVPFSELYVK